MSSSPQPPFISRLKLTNVLSFKDETIELRALNVIIGPNGSGKSNLISALEVLHATPTSLPPSFPRSVESPNGFVTEVERPL